MTLYWNALQWDCTGTAWKTLRQNQTPVLALRTMGGPASDETSKARRKVLRTAFPNLDEPRFALRLAASEPLIRTTIGGTACLAHLEEFLAAAKHASPLDEETLRKTEALRRG